VVLEAAIDAEVDQFRAFLDELDPTDFIDTTATEASSDAVIEGDPVIDDDTADDRADEAPDGPTDNSV